MKRKIIEIDRERCTGSGQCIPDCSEGAICVVEQEAEAYDERAVMGTIAPQGDGAIWAHLEHLLGHGETDLYRQAIGYLRETCIPVPAHRGAAPSAGCPGSAARVIERRPAEPARAAGTRAVSKLRQWPIQIRLLNPAAAYFDDADLLVAADCAPFACAGFPTSSGPAGSWSSSARSSLGISRSGWRGAEIFSRHAVRSVTVPRMEVPCCGGVRYVVDRTLEHAGATVPVAERTITIGGDLAPEPAGSR